GQTLPGILLAYQIPGLTAMGNTFSHAPLMRRFTLLTTLVARPETQQPIQHSSVTALIPARHEGDNSAAAIQRTPDLGTHTELLFVDGNSTDGTVEKIHQQMRAYPERDIKFLPQVPPHSPDSDTPADMMLKLGKGDAVRKGFEAASGDVLIILDSD